MHVHACAHPHVNNRAVSFLALKFSLWWWASSSSWWVFWAKIANITDYWPRLLSSISISHAHDANKLASCSWDLDYWSQESLILELDYWIDGWYLSMMMFELRSTSMLNLTHHSNIKLKLDFGIAYIHTYCSDDGWIWGINNLIIDSDIDVDITCGCWTIHLAHTSGTKILLEHRLLAYITFTSKSNCTLFGMMLDYCT